MKAEIKCSDCWKKKGVCEYCFGEIEGDGYCDEGSHFCCEECLNSQEMLA